jgi:hypothetical protein
LADFCSSDTTSGALSRREGVETPTGETWLLSHEPPDRGLPGAAGEAGESHETAGSGRPETIVLVVEGAARAAFTAPTGAFPTHLRQPGAARLEVTLAPGHGDDAIVREAATRSGPVLVITADRELRSRVTALGARIEGPRWLWSLLDADRRRGRGDAD